MPTDSNSSPSAGADPALERSWSGAADRLQVAVKRLVDVTIGVVALGISAPLWLAAALAIWLETGRPIFYKAVRIGQHGKAFKLYKFRSMVQDAGEMGSPLTVSGDSRITRVGAVLRRWRIDELPNLINVLRGEISLVGPRPESPKYVALYTPKQRRVLQVKPGITDVEFVKDYEFEEELLAQYDRPEEYYVSKLMPKKVGLNLEYVDRYPSLWMDFKILLLSVWTGLFGKSLT